MDKIMKKETERCLSIINGADMYLRDMFDRSGHRLDWQNRVFDKIIQIGLTCFEYGYQRGKEDSPGILFNRDELIALNQYFRTDKVSKSMIRYFESAIKKLEVK